MLYWVARCIVNNGTIACRFSINCVFKACFQSVYCDVQKINFAMAFFFYGKLNTAMDVVKLIYTWFRFVLLWSYIIRISSTYLA
jgi:hypothetical protein